MKTESLKKHYEFKRVYKKGHSVVGRYLVIYFLRNKTAQNHYGVTVSKKVGKSVIRSRVRRLIKENLRKFEEQIPPGYDIVIVARVAAAKADYHKIGRNMEELLKGYLKKQVKS
ncbi:MAG: hypothetical protein AVO33_04850 [delta proteobacterium ML8_F1]|nr:MAG: hypothetical protein AVO33_04850 [delta proteobacterium ML8_F1]